MTKLAEIGSDCRGSDCRWEDILNGNLGTMLVHGEDFVSKPAVLDVTAVRIPDGRGSLGREGHDEAAARNLWLGHVLLKGTSDRRTR